MKIATDLLGKWFPNGYKSKFQATPIGLIEDAINDTGGGPDYSGQIAALEARVQELETQLALHDNNGLHWTQQQVDERVTAGVDAHKAADHAVNKVPDRVTQ